MCHGQSQGRAVAQFVLLLDQTLAKTSPPDDHPTVVVLNGTGHDLARAGTPLIDEHSNVFDGQGVGAVGLVIVAPHGPAIGIDQKFVAILEQLVQHAGGLVEIAPGILPQVDDEVGHALLFYQIGQGIHEFFVSSGAESIDAHVADLVVDHVGSVHTVDGNAPPGNGEPTQFGFSLAQNAHFYFGTALSLQVFGDLVAGDVHTGNERITDHDDAVASQNAYLIARPVRQGADDDHRVLQHHELHSDPVEIPAHLLVGTGKILGGDVTAVRIEFGEDRFDGFVDQSIAVHFIHVLVFDVADQFFYPPGAVALL